MLVDSDLKIIIKNKIDKISVVSPYKTIKTRNLITEILAEGTPKKGLIMFNNKMLAVRRWNLQGITIRSSFVVRIIFFFQFFLQSVAKKICYLIYIYEIDYRFKQLKTFG